MSIYEYVPHHGALSDPERRDVVRRVLVLGGRDWVEVTGAEVRTIAPPDLALSNGLFWFPGAAGADALVSVNGNPPGEPDQVDATTAPPDHPILRARAWFEFLWTNAESIAPRARFQVDQYVRLAGSDDEVRVVAVHRLDGANVYTVQGRRGRLDVPEDGLVPIPIDPQDPHTWIDDGPTTAREFVAGMTVTKLSNPLTDTVYSYLSSKTVFRPYQFKPVLKLLGSQHQRLLIADEVGLGKTIEAGLIWSELEARNQGLNRALVVCPAVLTRKWRDEMLLRFDRRVPILDDAGLAELVDVVRSGDEHARAVGIVSLERLRVSKRLEELADLQPRFDLVIVDEAHYLRNRQARAFEMGELLATWADVLIFLSATPLNLGHDDLFNLLSLLVADEYDDPFIFPKQVEPNRYVNAAASALVKDPDALSEVWSRLSEVRRCELGSTVTSRPEFERIRELCALGPAASWRDRAEIKSSLQELNTLSSVLTRTRKVDVPDAKAVRQAVEVEVEWTEDEAALYLAVRRWAERRARESGGVPGFATQMPLRQAASCLPAMVQLVRERDPSVFSDPEDDDLDDIAELSTTTSRRDRPDLGGLVGEIAPLVERIGGTDTKFDRFVEYLREHRDGGEQVLLFSFFRRTLGYLQEQLSALGFSCRVLHGGVRDMDERQEIMRDFREGRFQLLLCSEVGSEGLDFEFCNMVVNYDLPWNPMRVEQRIGRLDRFGQTSERIFVLNFKVPGTIETEIFDRLYRRIRVFEESIGELEPILRDELAELTKLVLNPELTDDERRRRLHQMEIALEERGRQIEDIREAQSMLAGIDQLLIDGFERDTRSHGRFVGPRELRLLLEVYFSDLGAGRLHPVRERAHRWNLLGDTALGDAVARLGAGATGTRFRPGELAMLLRDQEPIEVTFSNEDASRTGTELISLRHPVVRTAVAHLAERPAGVKRFASLAVPGLPSHGAGHLVGIFLAASTGLRPTLELWPVAVDLATGEVSDDPGFAVLAAVADGTVVDGPPMPDDELLHRRLDAALATMRADLDRRQEQKRAENDALVDSQLATRSAGLRHQISRAEGVLEQLVRDRRGEAVQRLRRGQIRNLQQRLADLPGELERRRELAMTSQPVALAVVTGSEESTGG